MSDVNTALDDTTTDDTTDVTDDTTTTTDADATTDTTGSTDTTTDGGSDDAQAGYWPDDWQTRGDEKRQQLLARYGSPEAAFDALDAAQQRVRSGELLPALPDDPTEDELKEWRKSRGLPEDASGYNLEGFEIEAEDKPIIESLVASAHASHQGQDQVEAGITWYHEVKAAQAEARQELDTAQRDETVDALNVEWGANFRRNQNLVRGFLSRVFPDEVRVAFEGGRFADGRGFFNNPDMMRSLLALELELNPAGIKTPAGGGDIAKNRDDEIKEIQKLQSAPRGSKDRKEYDKNPEIQKRLLELIADRDGVPEV